MPILTRRHRPGRGTFRLLLLSMAIFALGGVIGGLVGRWHGPYPTTTATTRPAGPPATPASR
ncbi:MAG TPA: hypothetical protein VH475_19070 [Tepidisphaeraceae bacterium]